MTRRAPRRPRLMPWTQRVVTGVLAVVLLAAGVSAVASPATAVGGPVKSTLVGFTPGNIISDAVFTDSSTMSAAQIQAFFNAKVPTCLGGSDQYGPIVCLKDFRQDTPTRAADNYCSGYSGTSGETAAQIVYKVAQSCRMNPQVLIVMLQKESGLVTHVWPSAWWYAQAMGQACPDTAPCDPSFAGFFQQVYGAARQMQIYMEGRYFTWYAPGNTWNILYNPNTACGSSPVYVANKATSALYYYTPYQPNAAALAAGYGESDACGAYGNRNFYNYFTDWFGSTQLGGSAPPTIGSFDRDAYIVAANGSGGIYAYPYRSGRWGSPVSLATVAGATRVIPVGDLDGDGHRDLVVTTASGAFVLNGDGSGGFAAPRKLSVDWSRAVQITAAGDFTGDGIPDVFTVDAAGLLWLWPGTVNGDFGAPRQVGNGWSTMKPISGGADVDGDGVPDLYARDAAGSLFVYYGAAGSTWKGSAKVGFGFGGMPSIFQSGDVTGDGITDVVAITSAGAVALYNGVGGGSIANGPVSGNGWGVMASVSGAGPVVTGARSLPATAGVGDVDSDGARDVVGLSSAGALTLYRGDGAGGWRGTIAASSGWSANDRLIPLGDFTGDGRPDVGAIRPDGSFWLYPGAGDGTYGTPRQIGQGWGGIDMLVGGIDFDGDRGLDVIGRASNGSLILFRGDGHGGWIGSSTIGNGWGIATALLNAGDIDGDGRSDVLMRRTDGSLWIYPTSGAGGWLAPRQVGNGWGGMTALVAPGDFDGDGAPDLLARDGNGQLWLYAGAGGATWKAPRLIGWGWQMFTQLG
ncbi:FG-GAP-like repeat-containing protein [Microbacterium xylanilyticum]